MKKITLGLLTPVVIASPLLMAVSCGKEDALKLAASYTGKTHTIADNHITVIAPVAAVPDNPNTPEDEARPAVKGEIRLTKEIVTEAEINEFTEKIIAAAQKYFSDAIAAGNDEKKQIELAKTFMSVIINETFAISAHFVTYAKELYANTKFTNALATSKILKFNDTLIADVDTIPPIATEEGVTHTNLKTMFEDANLNLGSFYSESEYHWNYQYTYNALIVNRTENIFSSQGMGSDEKAVMDKIGLTNDKFVNQFIKTGVNNAKIFNLSELLAGKLEIK